MLSMGLEVLTLRLSHMLCRLGQPGAPRRATSLKDPSQKFFSEEILRYFRFSLKAGMIIDEKNMSPQKMPLSHVD